MDLFEEFFIHNGFRKLLLNTSGISLFLNNGEDRDLAIVLFFMPQGTEWSKEQCSYIEQQLRSKLQTNQERSLEMITFLITTQPEAVRDIYRENGHTGVINLRDYRLLLFEGMPADKGGIYHGLEQLLEVFRRSHGQELQQTMEIQHQKPSLISRIKKLGLVNLTLVMINIAVYVILLLTGWQEKAVEWGSLFWYEISVNKAYYRIFTSMFLHGNLEHLLYNMLTLGAIGNTLEKNIGKVKYLILYLLSGVVAALVSMSYNMKKELNIHSIGASGAIFGVIGALLLIVLVNKGRVDNLGKRQMLLFVTLSLYGGFTSQGVDNLAHVGGLIAGIILALIVYRKPKKRGTVE